MTVSYLMALAAGIGSFLSPCILPLVPTYLAIVGSGSTSQLSRSDKVIRAPLLTHTFAFVLGFSVIFVLMGLSAGVVGQFLLSNRLLLQRVAGVVIAVFGAQLLGLRLVPFLDRTIKPRYQQSIVGLENGLLRSALVGTSLAVGWTPCLTPVLSTILVYAASTESANTGALLLALYSLGLSAPFLLVSVCFSVAITWVKQVGRYSRFAEAASGAIMIGMGALVFTGYSSRLSGLRLF